MAFVAVFLVLVQCWWYECSVDGICCSFDGICCSVDVICCIVNGICCSVYGISAVLMVFVAVFLVFVALLMAFVAALMVFVAVLTVPIFCSVDGVRKVLAPYLRGLQHRLHPRHSPLHAGKAYLPWLRVYIYSFLDRDRVTRFLSLLLCLCRGTFPYLYFCEKLKY